MLTPKQQQTLEFIEDFIAHHGFAPSMAEIAEGLGISSRGVVHRYVKALAKAGWLKIIPGRRRNIELQQKKILGKKLPFLGKISAGKPIEAMFGRETIPVAETFLRNACFGLKVKDNSLLAEGIVEGDIIIGENIQRPESGQIVIVLIDNEAAALRRIHYNPDKTVTLIPLHPQLAPLVYAAARVTIQGLFLGIIRIAG